MKEDQFKIIMNGLWAAYITSMHIIDAMENMGCRVEPGSVNSIGFETPFSELYMLETEVENTIRDLFEIRDEEFVSDLNEFLGQIYSEYPDYTSFPDDVYPQFYNLLAKYGVSAAKEEPLSDGDPCYLLKWNDEYLDMQIVAGPFFDESSAKNSMKQEVITRLVELNVTENAEEAGEMYADAEKNADYEGNELHVGLEGVSISYGSGYEERYQIRGCLPTICDKTETRL